MSDAVLIAIVGAFNAIFCATLVYLVNRRTAVSATEIADRKEDREDLGFTITNLQGEVKRLAGRVETLEQHVDRLEKEKNQIEDARRATDAKLQVAIGYIRRLLTLLREGGIEPPAAPHDLELITEAH